MKKWSYVTALMLAASTGCVFTGCIDNDEPNGIEQIRIATADLLKSKKALAEAQAAAANAEVEIAKIQAEIEKAKLENEKLQAAARAEIERLQAEAQAAKTKAEAERILAMAEAIRMEAQAKVDSINAETARYIAQTEDWIKKAELAREKAAAQWEIDKLKAQTEQLGPIYYAVAQYYDNYLAALDKLNSLNKKLIKTQTLYAQFENDLVWVPAELGWENGEVVVKKEGYWSSPAVNLKAKFEKAVSIAESDVADAEETVKEYEELLANLDKISEGELNQLLLSYEAGLDDAEKAYVLALANVENIKIENQALFEQVLALDKKLNEFDAEEIEIPAYTYDPNDPAIASVIKSLPTNWQEKSDIVPMNQYYTLGKDENYAKYVIAYKSAIAGITSALLDENDKAWTNARLAEIERELAAKDTPFEKAKSVWEVAVKAYNNGQTPVAADLPGEKAIEDAITAYNTAAKALEAPYKKYGEDVKAYNAATEEVYQAQLAYYEPNGDSKAIAAYKEAYQTYKKITGYDSGSAYDARMIAFEKAEKDYNATMKAYETEYIEALNAYNTAVANQAVVVAEANGNAEDPKVKDAIAKTEAAKKAMDAVDAKYDETETTALEAKALAESKAWAAYYVAIEDADKAWHKAQKDLASAGGEADSDNPGDVWQDPEKDPAYAAVKTALDKQAKADELVKADEKALSDLYNSSVSIKFGEIETAIEAQEEAIVKQSGLTNWGWAWNKDAYADFKAQLVAYVNGVQDAELPVIVSPVMLQNEKKNYYNAKDLLLSISGKVYGNVQLTDFVYDPVAGTWKANGFDNFDKLPDAAMLVPMTPEMADEYIKNTFGPKPWYYPEYYDIFGMYGEILSLENEKEIGNASLNNADIINKITSELQANLKALEDGMTSAENTKKEMTHDLNELQAQTSALTADADAEVGKAERMVASYTDIVAILKNGVAQTELNKLYPNGQEPSGLEKAIEDANEALEGAQKALAAEQKVLEKAQYQLDRLMSGEAEYIVNPYTNDIESLKSEIAAQSDKVDYLKAALDALQAKYEALASK